MEREIEEVKTVILRLAHERLEEDLGCQGGFNAKVHSVIMDIQGALVEAMGGGIG